MKTIYPSLILVSLVTGLMGQPAPTNPGTAPAQSREEAIRQALEKSFAQVTSPAEALPGAARVGVNAATPPVAPPNAVINLTDTPATNVPPVRPVRTATTAADTNAVSTPPAFPAFPELPPPRRRAAAAAPGNVAPAAVNTAVPPGGVVDPANNVLGKPAAAITTAGPGDVLALPTEDETLLAPGMIKFQDSDLLQVLDIYQDLTGRTVVRPTSLPATKISVRSQTPLSRKEAVSLLDTILAMNGITMIPQGTKFVKAVAEGQAGPQAPEFLGEDAAMENTTRYVTKIIQLKNALPREVAPALQPLAKMANSIMAIDSSSILVLRDYEENIKRMEELLERIDVVPNNEFDPVIIPIKYALASDIAQVLSSLTAGGGGATTVGGRPAGTGLSTTPGIQNRGGGGQYGGAGGIGGINNQQGGYGNTAGGGGGAGGFGSPAAGRSSFQSRLNSIVNRAASGGDIVVLGQTKIIADERTNSLLVFATRGDIDTITNIIAKLDVVLAQVIIEAIIMEVSLDDTLHYGVSYLQSQPRGNNYFSGIGAINNGAFLKQNNFTALGSNAVGNLPSGFSYAARFGNDFEATATAIATDNRINVLSRPRIQTSHAVEANLFVGETRPYITGTYSYLGSGPSSQYSQLQIGITLSVLPLINQDGLVVMDIRQKIQSIGGTTKIDNNDIPITIDREANAKVAVRDGETVMLGGFISTDRSKSASGVPILKDIPILGNLFRSTSKNLSRKELMVLIRPTVLPNPQFAAVVAKEEKAKLPGISAAEREANRDERRQNKRLKADEAADQKKLEEEERKDQKKLGAGQYKPQKSMDNDIYQREGFSK